MHDAVAELFAPEQDRLRMPVDALTDMFLGLAFGVGRVPGGAAPRMGTAELVELFLHGAVNPGAVNPGAVNPAVTLNHTIVPARDNEAAAREFAEIMGLAYEGPDRHFAPVRVNDGLTVDFLTVAEPQGHHLAFDVDAGRFDAILARLRALGIAYGNDPAQPDNGRTDHPIAARGVLFLDSSGNLWEVMAPA